MKRRDFLKASACGAALTVTGTSLAKSSNNQSNEDVSNFAPTALKPEYTFNEKNELVMNPDQRVALASCYGCYATCSVRARVDNKTDKILRVAGNPYSPATADLPLDMNVSPREAFTQLSAIEEQGLAARKALCPRGNAVVDSLDDPLRLTQCLKRVGKRGENKWQTISYEQLIKEVTQGGDLFGEGEVEGLKAIYSNDALASQTYPDFGPVKNQLLATFTSEQHGRKEFFKRFMHDSWGTPNVGTKSAYCGVEAGSLGIKSPFSLDLNYCEYAIYFGHSPSMSGDNRNITAKRLGNASLRDNFKCVIVDPIMRSNIIDADRDKNEWIGIRSGTDTILVFALLQYVINNQRYNSEFLSIPGRVLADKASEVNYSNATHLVVTQKDHPLVGQFVTGKQLGLSAENNAVVIGSNSHKPVSSETTEHGQLNYQGMIRFANGDQVMVETAFSLLTKRVNEKTLQEYAQLVNVPVETIERMGKEFTSHGRRVAAIKYTGSNMPDGSQQAMALNILNSLVGSHNAKGGVAYGMGSTFSGKYDLKSTPLYDLMNFDKAEVVGTSTERDGHYEQSHEYQQKLKNGQPLYPADEPWLAGNALGHSGLLLAAHANKNPFQFKAWISWMTNPFYGCTGLQLQVEDSIADPKQLGLFIGVDGYINETNQFADYLVPDLVQYEQWNLGRMGASYVAADIVSAPVVEPKTAKTADGKSICMEQFLIDVAVELGMNGYGKNAFTDTAGKPYSLYTPEDYYVPLFANLAHLDKPLPKATQDDIQLTSVERIAPEFKQRLKPEELDSTLFLLTRGARYDTPKSLYKGEFFIPELCNGFECQIYDQSFTKRINSYTGKPFDGLPELDIPRFWDGTPYTDLWSKEEYPFTLASFKSANRSSYSVVLPRITALGKTNFVQMNQKDTNKLNLKDGDQVKVKFGNGQSAIGTLQADHTVAEGVVAICHGFGHTAMGAKDITVDGKVIPARPERQGGIAFNHLCANDPTIKGASILRERYTGGSTRSAIPVAIEKA